MSCILPRLWRVALARGWVMAGACWVSCLGCYQPIALLHNNSESLCLCQFEYSPCPFCLNTLNLFTWKVMLNSSGTVKRVIPMAVLFSFGKYK